MSEVDYYDIVRQKMTLGPLTTPKNKKIIKLLKVFWNEEEIKILSHFNKADEYITLSLLEEKSGMPKDKLKKMLERLVEVGTISKRGNKYCLEPIIPGIFEKYFQRSRDSEENLKKAAELYRYIINEVMPQHSTVIDEDWHLFRPLLPLEANEKLVEINKNFDVKAQTLPYETVKNIIEKYDEFAVISCQCRLINELLGKPCEIAPAAMGCFVAGPAGKMMVDNGIHGARLMNKQEAIEFLKETEKRGLVHNAVFDKGAESSVFFCNCCSCCCGAIYPGKAFAERSVYQSNYSPKFNNELCTKCETCMKKCPMNAIYHQFSKETMPEERMVLREQFCIGCGVCAANCPNNAIKMIKTRDEIPPDRAFIGNKTFTDMII
ncbi:MAG: 4Fe-4S binding protein [Candidatus Hermodarchaeota archaeon]